MPEEALDFWPNIEPASTPTPGVILKQQAALLGKHTNNLLQAFVRTESLASQFVHTFVIYVPTIAYQYELFVISHGVNLYPVHAQSGMSEAGQRLESTHLQSEDEFVAWLKDRLNSLETIKLLSTLLAQVED